MRLGSLRNVTVRKSQLFWCKNVTYVERPRDKSVRFVVVTQQCRVDTFLVSIKDQMQRFFGCQSKLFVVCL